MGDHEEEVALAQDLPTTCPSSAGGAGDSAMVSGARVQLHNLMDPQGHSRACSFHTRCCRAP